VSARASGFLSLPLLTMRIHSRFIKLPFTFDHAKLADEISQFGEEEWRPHVSGFKGNSSLILVSTNGAENDNFSGPMRPSPRLQRTPYIRQIMAKFNTVVGRSRLMRLAPGASVTQHTDSHYFWRHHLRIHIPIITDPDVAFYCDTEEVHMAAGESWTFNNWLVHSVENRSDKTRIHLVIDTVGSADLWRLIDGRDDTPQRVEFVAEEDPEPRFESFHGLPVMPFTELSADLGELVEEIAENDANDSLQIDQLRVRTADFIHDWHSHWMVYGPTIDGFPGFKSLLESYRGDIDQVSDQLLLGSNHKPFKEAVSHTLDAAITPQNFSAGDESSATSGSLPAHRPRFDRPIFIVAAPRSGSTLLFETFALNRELWSLGDESHKHFESILPLRPNEKNPSNRLTADMATSDVVETLMNSFAADLVDSDSNKFTQLSPLSRPNEVRFLEKTPKNALRIPFIIKAFPGARFIFLFRDAKQNISSLLESWRSGRFVTYSRLPGWPADKPWSHLLIPGWQDLINRSLAEIATQQWLVTNQIILDDLRDLPHERWCAIEYDSLLVNTSSELERLCFFSQVIFGPRMREAASTPLKHSKYTLIAPHPDKWKKNAAELNPVIPSTEELMATLRGLI
jgi:hypothetical protein